MADTAFQPNAFQSDAFQIYGGTVGAGCDISISATNGDDTCSIELRIPSGGAPGRRVRYVIYINGRRHVGYYEEIQAILESLAESDAEKVSEGKKPAKRRIVVQPGKQAPSKAPNVEPIFDFKSIQADFRNIYQDKLALAILHEYDESDDEDVLLLI